MLTQCKIPKLKDGITTVVEIVGKVINENTIAFVTCIDLGAKIGT